MESVVLHPELLRTYKVGPKSQNEYLMKHMGFRPSRSSPSSGGSGTTSVAGASAEIDTAGKLASSTKPPASASSTASSRAEPVAVRDPYPRAALMGPPLVSAELASHAAMMVEAVHVGGRSDAPTTPK
eukprot:CAMPEP_0170295998 /NCGR_PEP_ID=MMETSP0116_2-20130129/48129_1 /TAXON_ID=400756 /ORGANISM="Durinskia baltica, Strain CSIRO CS-38" /LENGTH=127 /DNA_ID=CAMNT_0010547561 /DNA_START=97 /DNA_END=478 /DNA_ORIENTATION=-